MFLTSESRRDIGTHLAAQETREAHLAAQETRETHTTAQETRETHTAAQETQETHTTAQETRKGYFHLLGGKSLDIGGAENPGTSGVKKL